MCSRQQLKTSRSLTPASGQRGIRPVFESNQLDKLNSAFRLLVACSLAAKSSAKSDGLLVCGRNAGFLRSNRKPLLGILGFWVAWTTCTPQMQKNRTIRAYGMVTELTVGN